MKGADVTTAGAPAMRASRKVRSGGLAFSDRLEGRGIGQRARLAQETLGAARAEEPFDHPRRRGRLR